MYYVVFHLQNKLNSLTLIKNIYKILNKTKKSKKKHLFIK